MCPGQGALSLKLHIAIQDVIFLRRQNTEMMLDIENIRLINGAEEWAEVVSQPSTISIDDGGSTGLAADATLRRLPVPATDGSSSIALNILCNRQKY